jgi:hypothetical protein
MAKKKQNTKKKNGMIKIPTKEYALILADIKNKIQQAQVSAAVAAGKELALLYWTIGRIIAEKQEKNGWGASFVEQLAHDLQNDFPQ